MLQRGASGGRRRYQIACLFVCPVPAPPAVTLFPSLLILRSSSPSPTPHPTPLSTILPGDAGSQSLGALIGAAGLLVPDGYLALLALSSVYALECLSVVAQVGFRKWTLARDGVARKLLRMAPLHHHLELGGLSEPRIVQIFSAASAAMLGAVVAVTWMRR